MRAWLETARAGTLATLLHDERAPGTPFASPVPYALDVDPDAPVDRWTVVIVVSELAVHTKNLRADPRASLLVGEPGHEDDPWSGWRVTLVGTMRPVDPAADPAGHARAHTAFKQRHPAAPALPGFAPWALDVATMRVVAGFGRMGWL